jgi:hypothetical protein
MLPCQRALFDIPREVCFLNAASWSPLPLAVQEAGRAAVARKGQPWKLPADFQPQQYERARKAAAALIGADSVDVSLIPSVGYGVATAGKVLTIPRGSRVLVLQDDHTSPVLEWMSRARGGRLHGRDGEAAGRWRLDVGGDGRDRPVRAPNRSPWSRSPQCTGPTAARSTWRASPAAAKAKDSALLVDATHDVGIRRIDVKTLDPDFLIFPTYKWVLGPYGRAFMYVAKRRQNGVPLEQISGSRKAVSAEDTVYFRDIAYVEGARRYDMGERDHFISMEMAAIGMEMMAAGATSRSRRGLPCSPTSWPTASPTPACRCWTRSCARPHVLSLYFPKGMATDLPKKLAPRTSMPRRGSDGCASARTSTTTSRMSKRFVEVFRKVAM